ncbi:hypothetical protein C0J52_00058 [Blattella germanica]|nr:hypothetical protein C0J52_00058 [Blattella germanica]
MVHIELYKSISIRRERAACLFLKLCVDKLILFSKNKMKNSIFFYLLNQNIKIFSRHIVDSLASLTVRVALRFPSILRRLCLLPLLRDPLKKRGREENDISIYYTLQGQLAKRTLNHLTKKEKIKRGKVCKVLNKIRGHCKIRKGLKMFKLFIKIGKSRLFLYMSVENTCQVHVTGIRPYPISTMYVENFFTSPQKKTMHAIQGLISWSNVTVILQCIQYEECLQYEYGKRRKEELFDCMPQWLRRRSCIFYQVWIS